MKGEELVKDLYFALFPSIFTSGIEPSERIVEMVMLSRLALFAKKLLGKDSETASDAEVLAYLCSLKKLSKRQKRVKRYLNAKLAEKKVEITAEDLEELEKIRELVFRERKRLEEERWKAEKENPILKLLAEEIEKAGFFVSEKETTIRI